MHCSPLAIFLLVHSRRLNSNDSHFVVCSSFVKRARCLKIHQNGRGSETGALWSGRFLIFLFFFLFFKREGAWVKSNMWHVHTTDDLKVASLKELCICILKTDSEREAGKVFLHCSQNINATHLSASLHCNSKHLFSFLRVCVCISKVCIYEPVCAVK